MDRALARSGDGIILVNGILATWLFASLLCHGGAHVALVGGFLARRSVGRALLAIVVPPLAPYWGWELGMHKRAFAWGGTLLAYGGGIAVAVARGLS